MKICINLSVYQSFKGKFTLKEQRRAEAGIAFSLQNIT